MYQQSSRKNGLHLRVPVLPDEAETIKNNAKATGLSVASFLRNLALGFEVKSVLDLEKIDELAKINADLGRLGGLFKLWLSNNKGKSDRREVLALLYKIETNQAKMRAVMSKLL